MNPIALVLLRSSRLCRQQLANVLNASVTRAPILKSSVLRSFRLPSVPHTVPPYASPLAVPFSRFFAPLHSSPSIRRSPFLGLSQLGLGNTFATVPRTKATLASFTCAPSAPSWTPYDRIHEWNHDVQVATQSLAHAHDPGLPMLDRILHDMVATRFIFPTFRPED